jgi:hypothetical protein
VGRDLKRRLPMALLVAAALACGEPQEPCGVCTEELRLSPVTVLDAGGQPVGGLQFSVVRVEDGRDVTPEQAFAWEDGLYIVLTDGELDFVDEEGTAFRVTASNAQAGVTADFVFNTDACRCHISKVSGPDTIQLVPTP